MSDYTPGPWTAKGNAYNYWGVYSPNETLLAEAPFKYRPANIRLMAAAPEMKDLLWDAWQDLNALSNGDQSCDARYEATETMEKIMSLLRRIEGEEGTNA